MILSPGARQGGSLSSEEVVDDEVEKPASMPKKKIASSTVMMITMIAVATVSLRVGHWTFAVPRGPDG